MSDTLFLAVSFVDRFLSVKEVQRSQLQLVGVACLLIAAKYEEIYAPQVLPLLSSASQQCALPLSMQTCTPSLLKARVTTRYLMATLGNQSAMCAWLPRMFIIASRLHSPHSVSSNNHNGSSLLSKL